MDYILYFKVETLDEREYATSVLEENGFTCIDECGGQAAFEDGDFGLFINCARSTSLDFLQLCRMPDPGLGLLSSNPMTGAPDPRLEEWAVTGQLISPEQHFARLHWNAVRRNVYTRAIFFYWRELTSHIYAPGGVGESRDRESFEANFRGLVPPCLAALYDKQMKHAEVDQKFRTCLFTRLDENELTPAYKETAPDQMDHIRVIQEVVDEHKDEMPTGVVTRVMAECQKAYGAAPAQEASAKLHDPRTRSERWSTAHKRDRRAFENEM